MPEDIRQRYCAACLTTFDGDPDRCPNLGCRRRRPTGDWGTLYGPGDVFDRNYKILDHLAMGGAGVTYLARELGEEDEIVGPKLAIKVLFEDRDHGAYLRRLATEAQIIQELDHSNIVQYLGFVHRAGHSPYLVTRFEEGGSLLDHVKRVGLLDPKHTAFIGRQICWALMKGHDKGIVHRDLKPENVLLTRAVTLEEDPVIRVADFGIAKVQGSLGSGITRVGAFVGTPHYAAPEQFMGASATAQTDIYAVGAIMYFCMTGKTVISFANRLAPADAYELLVDNLPPVVERPDLPPAELDRVNRVLAATMAPRREHRPSLDELDEWLAGLVTGRNIDAPELGIAATDDDTMDHTLSDPGLPPVGAGVHAAPTVDEFRSAPNDDIPDESRQFGPWEGPQEDSTLVQRAARPPKPAPPLPVAAPGGDAKPISDPAITLDSHKGEEEPTSGGAGLVLGGFLAVAVLVVGLAAAAGLAWYFWPSGGGREQREPTELTGRETDPGKRADWRAISESLAASGPDAARQCNVRGSGSMPVELVVEADGALRSVKILKGGERHDRQCIASKLGDDTLTRRGQTPVKVQAEVAW